MNKTEKYKKCWKIMLWIALESANICFTFQNDKKRKGNFWPWIAIDWDIQPKYSHAFSLASNEENILWKSIDRGRRRRRHFFFSSLNNPLAGRKKSRREKRAISRSSRFPPSLLAVWRELSFVSLLSYGWENKICASVNSRSLVMYYEFITHQLYLY